MTKIVLICDGCNLFVVVMVVLMVSCVRRRKCVTVAYVVRRY
jgi:hypothetical protein